MSLLIIEKMKIRMSYIRVSHLTQWFQVTNEQGQSFDSVILSSSYGSTPQNLKDFDTSLKLGFSWSHKIFILYMCMCIYGIVEHLEENEWLKSIAKLNYFGLGNSKIFYLKQKWVTRFTSIFSTQTLLNQEDQKVEINWWHKFHAEEHISFLDVPSSCPQFEN